MKTKNYYWIIAGALNFATFFLHLIGGQIDLLDPMMAAPSLTLEKSTQLLGAWHMVTLILLVTSYILISAGLGKKYASNLELIKGVGYLNWAFCLPSILASFYYGIFVPQWVFFVPIAGLTMLGVQKREIAE